MKQQDQENKKCNAKLKWLIASDNGNCEKAYFARG